MATPTDTQQETDAQRLVLSVRLLRRIAEIAEHVRRLEADRDALIRLQSADQTGETR